MASIWSWAARAPSARPVMTGETLGELVFVFDLDQYTVCSWLTSAKVRVCEVGEGSPA